MPSGDGVLVIGSTIVVLLEVLIQEERAVGSVALEETRGRSVAVLETGEEVLLSTTVVVPGERVLVVVIEGEAGMRRREGAGESNAIGESRTRVSVVSRCGRREVTTMISSLTRSAAQQVLRKMTTATRMNEAFFGK